MTYRSQFDKKGMSQAALDAWERFEEATGRGWGINSAYRSPDKNEAVGGAKKSQHMHGNALDVDVGGLSEAERVNLIKMARASGFGGVGVYDNALHFDVADERHWGPDFKARSTPEWARPALQAGRGLGDDHGHDHGNGNGLEMAQMSYPEAVRTPSYHDYSGGHGGLGDDRSAGLEEPEEELTGFAKWKSGIDDKIAKFKGITPEMRDDPERKRRLANAQMLMENGLKLMNGGF